MTTDEDLPDPFECLHCRALHEGPGDFCSDECEDDFEAERAEEEDLEFDPLEEDEFDRFEDEEELL